MSLSCPSCWLRSTVESADLRAAKRRIAKVVLLTEIARMLLDQTSTTAARLVTLF